MDPIARLAARDRAVIWGGLAVLVLAAWGYLLYLQRAMAGMEAMSGHLVPWTAADFAFTGAMWAIMMVGMMLPSAAPVILLFAAVNRKRREQGGVGVPTAIFAAGYLLVWGGFSVGAALAQWGLHAAALLSPALATTSPVVGGAFLVAAGVYQLTPLKQVCLAHCRSPLGFFMTEWRDGAPGALRMGLRHGSYCLGCCWLLMGLVFVTGVMNLLWVATIAAFVLVEKVAPAGRLVGRVASWGLIAAGLVVLGQATRGGGDGPPLGQDRGAAMALASVSAVSHSLRLRRFRRAPLLGLGLLVGALLGTAVPATAQDPALRGTVTMPSVVAGTVGHLRVELREPDGRPASGLGVRAEVFQGMGRQASATLAAEAPGVYTGRLALDGTDGVWQGVVRVDAASRPLIADIAFTVRRELEADVAASSRPLRFRKAGPWTPRPWLDPLVGLGLLGGLLVGAGVLAARPLPVSRPRRALPLPAWLVGVGIAGALAGPLGAYWDVAWHVDAGRDTFWSAPHVMIYGSIAAVVVSVLVAGGGLRRGALRHPGLRFTVVAGAVTMASAPLDEAWHALFGLDVSIWSPPHLVLLFGTAFSMLGLALVHADRLADLRGRLAVVMLAAAALLIGSVFVLEFEFVRLERWHVLMARPRGAYALSATTLTVLVLASVARLGGPGAATAAAAVAFALRAGVSLVFLPALGRTAPLLPPLYVVPAVALDLVVALAPAAWSPQRRFAVAGVAATALAYVTHNPAAALLGGRAVPPDALWAWFPVALLAGAAAAHLGLRIGTVARPAPAS